MVNYLSQDRKVLLFLSEICKIAFSKMFLPASLECHGVVKEVNPLIWHSQVKLKLNKAL